MISRNRDKLGRFLAKVLPEELHDCVDDCVDEELPEDHSAHALRAQKRRRSR